MGRKSKEDIILQNLDVISEMKKKGCSDVKIFKHIKVSPATFYKFLKTNKIIQEAWDGAKVELAADLENDLYKLARGGFVLTTKKTVIKSDKDGKEVILEEITEKESPPNLGALIFILKNISPEQWVNDPKMLEIKKKELELKEKAMDNLW